MFLAVIFFINISFTSICIIARSNDSVHVSIIDFVFETQLGGDDESLLKV